MTTQLQTSPQANAKAGDRAAQTVQPPESKPVAAATQPAIDAQASAPKPAPEANARPKLSVVDSTAEVEVVVEADSEINIELPAPRLGRRVPEPLVHEGRDGWLFLVAGSNHVLDMYKKRSSFTARMGRKWVKLLQGRSKRLAAKGIQYLHMPAPEKLTVLHKFYDGEIENINGSPIYQMAEKHAEAVPCLVNVLPFFEKQVDETLLYWKTDTHWSFWGCFSAYQLLCARMGVAPNTDLLQYPFAEGPVLFDLGAKLDEPTKETARFYQLTQNAERVYANTVVRFKEDHGLINEPNLHVGSSVVYRNNAPNAIDKCVMLFGDSFSEYRDHLLTGMLAETFREVHFVWNASIDYDYVERVQPDVVITELAERFMTRMPDDTFNLQKFAAERLDGYVPPSATNERAAMPPMSESVIVENVIMPSESYHLHPPKTVQNDCKNINNDKEMKTSPIRLVEVKKAEVYFTGDKLSVKAPGVEVVSRYGINDAQFSALPRAKHRQLSGTSLLLGNSMGAHCYYHWMLDLLPKLGMLEKAGIPLSSIDHFIVREMNGSFQKQTLHRLGIDGSRVVETKNENHVDCERLLILNIDNGINLKMNRFIPTWLKHLYPPVQPVGKPIKLYISRPQGVRRGVANEAQILPILRRAGYTIASMEGMSVEEQSQLLARAEVLISPHGGALTNMVFCKPGVKVVELFGRHVYPFYYGLAQMCGHEYHSIMETAEDYPRLIQYSEAMKVGSADFQKQTRESSFDVNLETLKETLAALEA